jgi:hypothetical protein
MRGDRDGGAAACETALEFIGEHEVGQLELAVCAGSVVGAYRPVEVVQGERGPAVVGAADGDHARARHVEQPVEQQSGQGEVSQVVGADVHLEAVGGGGPRHVHDARVVDEQVEPGMCGTQFPGRCPHRVQ